MPTMGVHTVLVTGAGSPAGQAVVTALAAGGHQVCAADPDAAAVQWLVDEAGPGVVLGVAGCSRDPDHQDDAVDYALTAFERIDGLVMVIPERDAGHPSGWIYRVQLAWMAERGGSVTTIFPVSGPVWEATVAAAQAFAAEVAARVGPRTRVTAVVVPGAEPGAGVGGLRAVPGCGVDLPGLVLRLLSTRTSELAGRALVPRPTGGWTAYDGEPVGLT